MSLNRKKKLIARTLGVGANRVILDTNAKEEIKEAITRQDIRELANSGVIRLKPIRGVKKKMKKKSRKKFGSRKKMIKKRKQVYVKLTRKLRNYLKKWKNINKIKREDYEKLARRIRAKELNMAHLKEALRELR